MCPQLNYDDQSLTPALKGGLADAGFNDKVGANSAAAVKFGLGLDILATGLVAIPAATGFLFHGVSIQIARDIDRVTGIAQYDQGDEISILKRGRIWVFSEQAVNPTLAVFLRHTINAALLPGDFRVDADTANADDVSAFARWVSVTTAAGLAIVELNIP